MKKQAIRKSIYRIMTPIKWTQLRSIQNAETYRSICRLMSTATIPNQQGKSCVHRIVLDRIEAFDNNRNDPTGQIRSTSSPEMEINPSHVENSDVGITNRIESAMSSPQPSQVFKQENAIRAIQLKCISPKRQLSQLIRVLPTGSVVGQITNSQTLNYKTLKPEKDGLFCERIFGPTQDYICGCGKRQKSKSLRYCPTCEVEYTLARVRRYRLGFIRLGLPIAHIWYLKGRPSYLALLLDMKKADVEAIAYGATCIFQNYSPEFRLRINKIRNDFNERFCDFRHAANTRPKQMMLYKMQARKVVLENFPFAHQKADDFWVHSKTNHDFYRDDWLKTNFLRKKPFFQIPLIRDHFNFGYRGDPENLYNVEDYFFTFKRTYGSMPIDKYKKAIPNSMICYQSSQNIEVLLTGGLAFYHLFSKIDCHRLKETLTHHILQVRKTLLYWHLIGYARKKFGTTNMFGRDPIFTKKEKKQIKWLRTRIAKTARRIKLFRMFWHTGSRPEWMFISILPVLPPDLRPIIKMSNGQLAISDLNRLYQAVFHRNRNMRLALASISIHVGMDLNQIEDLVDLTDNHQCFRFSTSIVCFQQNLLQQAVDALFENGKGGANPVCGPNNRPLKSLSDILKGKTGRFRQNLLGKRVDYSGRSVIVVGPKLKLYQCGLPKELALELFQSLLIRKLRTLKIVGNIVTAKQLIRIEHPIIWPLLNELMSEFPILLNRAPTLHRLGVQAFLPKLVRGKAILLHPLVCPAFNADFDGDQMGVHLPLSVEAKSEAWSLMLSTQNMLSPATGDPILIPSQDMVLGCYYLTTLNPLLSQPEKQKVYFTNIMDVYKAYLAKQFHAHDFIWLRWPKLYYSDQPGKTLLEIRLRRLQCIQEKMLITSTNHKTYFLNHMTKNGFSFSAENGLKDQFIRTTVGRVILNQEFQQQFNKSTVQYIKG